MSALKKYMAHKQLRAAQPKKIVKDEADDITRGEGEHHDMEDLRGQLSESASTKAKMKPEHMKMLGLDDDDYC